MKIFFIKYLLLSLFPFGNEVGGKGVEILAYILKKYLYQSTHLERFN